MSMFPQIIKLTYDVVFDLKLFHDLNLLLNPFKPRSCKPAIIVRVYLFTLLSMYDISMMSKIMVLWYPIDKSNVICATLSKWISKVSQTTLICLRPCSDVNGGLWLGWWLWSRYLIPSCCTFSLPPVFTVTVY